MAGAVLPDRISLFPRRRRFPDAAGRWILSPGADFVSPRTPLLYRRANPALPPLQSLLFVVPVAIIGVALYWRIASSLSAAGETGLLIPVAIYSFAISVMLFSAWATLWRGDWTTSRRVLVITGASLFFASDAMLAWNKFVKPFRAAEIGVIVTYHLGQLALAGSIGRDW